MYKQFKQTCKKKINARVSVRMNTAATNNKSLQCIASAGFLEIFKPCLILHDYALAVRDAPKYVIANIFYALHLREVS